MDTNGQTAYLGYQITVAQDKARFTPMVSRDGGLISHDGRKSEVWTSESCGSYDRAVWVARKAIDMGRTE
jgi:hypothetical protein